jgi:hypothetical protein
MHGFMDIDFPTVLIYFFYDYIISINIIKFSKIFCVQNSLFLCLPPVTVLLGPFIHMTRRKYVTII